MHNTVAHLNNSAFIRKPSLIVFLLHLRICETITFCKCDNRYRDILHNRDNFVVDIEI